MGGVVTETGASGGDTSNMVMVRTIKIDAMMLVIEVIVVTVT